MLWSDVRPQPTFARQGCAEEAVGIMVRDIRRSETDEYDRLAARDTGGESNLLMGMPIVDISMVVQDLADVRGISMAVSSLLLHQTLHTNIQSSEGVISIAKGEELPRPEPLRPWRKPSCIAKAARRRRGAGVGLSRNFRSSRFALGTSTKTHVQNKRSTCADHVVRTEPGESDDLVLRYSAQATGSRAGVPGFGRLGKEFHAKLESGSPRIPWKALATDICHANDASSAAPLVKGVVASVLHVQNV